MEVRQELDTLEYLNGKREFAYSEYEVAFTAFKSWVDGEQIAATEYIRDPEALLQFFFDVNVIGYRELVGQEKERFIHFAYRERTLMNVAPKVKTTGVLLVNPGIAKSLDLGLKSHAVTPNSSPAKKRARRRRYNDKSKFSGGTSNHNNPTFGAATASSKPASGKPPFKYRPKTGA